MLGKSAGEYDAAGMRVSSYNNIDMIISWRREEYVHSGLSRSCCWSLSISGYCSQMRGKWSEKDRQVAEASAVKRSLYRSMAVKRGLSQKAKLSIYLSTYLPILKVMLS